MKYKRRCCGWSRGCYTGNWPEASGWPSGPAAPRATTRQGRIPGAPASRSRSLMTASVRPHEYDTLIASARRLPGFGHFLAAIPFGELRNAGRLILGPQWAIPRF